MLKILDVITTRRANTYEIPVDIICFLFWEKAIANQILSYGLLIKNVETLFAAGDLSSN